MITPEAGLAAFPNYASKHWCFKIVNYTHKDVYLLTRFPTEYLIYCFRLSATDQPPCIQGYLALKKRMRVTGLRKLISHACFERRRGTPKELSDLFKKDSAFTESGTLPQTCLESRQRRQQVVDNCPSE